MAFRLKVYLEGVENLVKISPTKALRTLRLSQNLLLLIKQKECIIDCPNHFGLPSSYYMSRILNVANVANAYCFATFNTRDISVYGPFATINTRIFVCRLVATFNTRDIFQFLLFFWQSIDIKKRVLIFADGLL